MALLLVGDALGVDMLAGASVDIASTVFSELSPAEYRADIVVRISDAAGVVRRLVIVEIQLNVDRSKRYTWPHYQTGVRVRERCPVTLAIIAVNERVARWCSQPIELDEVGSVVRPVVIGPNQIPLVTDIDYARRWPELAVLSAVAHGQVAGGGPVAAAALDACRALDNERSTLYADLILNSLGDLARQAMETLMQQRGHTYQSDFAKKYVAEGHRDILRALLQRRFGELPADLAGKLDNAGPETLMTWAERVLTAKTPAEVFAE